MAGLIQNATTSINYWFQQNMQVPADAAVGVKVCLYFEGNQRLTYPGIVFHHFVMGGWSSSLERYNAFSVDIQVNKDKDFQAWALQDVVYNTLGFTPDNVLQIKQIPLLDWSTPSSPADTTKCIRLVMNPGQSFTFMDDIDKSIRHYRLDLEAYYR